MARQGPAMIRLLRRFVFCLVLGAFALPGAALASEGGAAPKAGPAVVKIKPVMLPVTTERGVIEKYNQIEVTVELASAATLPDAQAAVPRLQSAILGQFYQAIDSGLIVRGAVANAGALRKRLADACEDILGKGTVSRVLISTTSRQSAWP
jgi:flagellar basal body-associated protein FliL